MSVITTFSAHPHTFIGTYLNVSKIIVKRTNLPKRGTTNDVGGIISARSRKNTVSDSKMEIDKLTWKEGGESVMGYLLLRFLEMEEVWVSLQNNRNHVVQ